MRESISFDDGWKFCPEDLPPRDSTDGWGGAKARAYSQGAPAEDFDDSKWRTVHLPHDFVSEKEYCFQSPDSWEMRRIPEMESIGSRLFAGGCLEGGIAWYRKKFRLPGGLEDKRVYLYFDGVYRSSTLYINQYYVGTHASGYTGFYYDITDFLNMDGENIAALRVDASGREGWWYEGGGIYRHVWLEIADSVHMAPWGVSVQAEPDLKSGRAALRIRADIVNRSFEKKQVRVQAEILDPDGNRAAEIGGTVSVREWDRGEYSEELALEKAALWDLEQPYLYSAVFRLYTDGELREEYTVPFGIREFRFQPEGVFYLNGRHVRIQGLCCHHDHAGVGIGIPDSVNEYRILKMKGMGANALRIAHYPASSALLDICDRLGMLVFEETRRMSSAPEDIQCLKSMVRRDRNHPSIFLWGIGNEEIFSQHRPETARATRTMLAEIRKLDPTRCVTSAVVCWDGVQRYDNAEKYVPVTKHLDVMGFNYCPTAWDDYHERVPWQPILITEAASNSGTRGCYSTDEATGQYYVLDPENPEKIANKCKAVKKDLGESEWDYFAKRPYLAGIFLWTGFDYRGEPTPLQYPAVYSQFGIFDYCGFEKDNYYYYKSWWQEKDVVHVFPHWNREGKTVGGPVNVYCYSNLEEAELFVNGKSQGKKQMQKNWYLTWENVIYEPGELKVIGYRDGQPAAEDVVRTTGEPFAIRLQPYKDTIVSSDTAIINVDIVDRAGDTVPGAENELCFEIIGPGVLLGTGNGDPGDHDSEKLPARRAFHGKCQLLVRADGPGSLKIAAASEGLRSDGLELTVLSPQGRAFLNNL